MYQFAYEEVAADTAQSARQRESSAFRHAIDLLEDAKEQGVNGPACTTALHQVNRLCCFMAEDLASPGNSLPEKLRADLISIYLWILQECERIRQLKSDNISGLIDILSIIADGLEAGQCE